MRRKLCMHGILPHRGLSYSVTMSRSIDHDLYLLSEFKKALRRYADEPVLNLDEKFPHKFELFVQAHEMIIDKIGERIPPNKWSYYRLGLVTQGWAEYVSGIYRFRAEKNTLVIIPPRVINSSEWCPERDTPPRPLLRRQRCSRRSEAVRRSAAGRR